MKPALALLPFLFLFLFAVTTESRKDQGEYWKKIMKDQEMPEGIQGLLQMKSENSKQLAEGSNHKCEGTLITNTQDIKEKKVFIEEFEPRPNLSAYDDDTAGNKKYTKEVEPRPGLTAYIGDEKPGPVNTEFEPRPSVTAYIGDEKPGQVNTEFEPRPSASKYND